MANYKVVDTEQLDADLRRIGDAIREKTGGTEQLNFPDEMASEMDAVFKAGKKAEYDRFWDAFQDNGNRTNYNQAFNGYGFNSLNFYPKYNITTIDASSMFINWNRDTHAINLKERMEECGVKFDFSKTTNFLRVFYYVNRVTEFPEMDMSMATSLNQTFAYNYAMVSIEKLIVGAGTVFQGTFESCGALQNLIIGGTIGQNGFNVGNCTKLTHESLMSIVNALKDYSGSGATYTVTLGATNLNKLTDEEKAIATGKGWTLA